MVDSGRISAAGAPLLAALRWMRRRHDESPCIRARALRYTVLGFGSARDVSCCAVMGQRRSSSSGLCGGGELSVELSPLFFFGFSLQRFGV